MRFFSLLILLSLAVGRPVLSQDMGSDDSATLLLDLPDAPSAVVHKAPQRRHSAAEQQAPGFVHNVPLSRRQTDWDSVGRQSFVLLSVQHSLRLLQAKTRRELKGPVFEDYARSIRGIHGWGDGDGIFTNYLLHPGMGSVASYIYIQNTPSSQRLVFDPRSGAYWRSRLKAMGFAAAYSTQFEIGPISEAMIGNVGIHRGTNGYVDFIMTPVGGLGLTVLEDYLDERHVRKLEQATTSKARQRLLRVVMNPERSIANLLRLKKPWHRDTRRMPTQ